jgi:hypothetical protein
MEAPQLCILKGTDIAIRALWICSDINGDLLGELQDMEEGKPYQRPRRVLAATPPL